MVAFVVLVIAILLALALRSRNFTLVLGACALAAVMGMVAYSVLWQQERKARINAWELEFAEVQFIPYLNGYSFSAQVKNTNQDYRVKQLELGFNMLACTHADNNQSCAPFATVTRLVYVDIAPLATAVINQTVHFATDVAGLDEAAWRGWNYQVLQVYAIDDGRLF